MSRTLSTALTCAAANDDVSDPVLMAVAIGSKSARLSVSSETASMSYEAGP